MKGKNKIKTPEKVLFKNELEKIFTEIVNGNWILNKSLNVIPTDNKLKP